MLERPVVLRIININTKKLIGYVEKAEKAKKRIAEKYDKDPDGWSVYTSRDKDRFYDTLVTHDEDAWYIKEFSINPYKTIGVAERKKESFDEVFNFGLREIEDPSAVDIMKILQSKPLRSGSIKTPYVLGGPVIRKRDLSISGAQEELDTKLRLELKKIVDKEYSYLSYPYL